MKFESKYHTFRNTYEIKSSMSVKFDIQVVDFYCSKISADDGEGSINEPRLCDGYMRPQRTHDVTITSPLRQNNSRTSFWRNDNVIITSRVRWVQYIDSWRFVFIKRLIKNTTVPLTLCGLVTSYSIDEEGTSLVHVMTCRLSAPSHYPNQCWLVVEWTLKNKFRWNMNQNTAIYIQEMHLKMLSTKRRTFCSGLMLSYQCRNPHVKDKTVSPSLIWEFHTWQRLS